MPNSLKPPSQTWQSAFEEFLTATSQCNRDIVTGIQYFHNCCSAVIQLTEFDMNDADCNHAEMAKDGAGDQADGTQVSRTLFSVSEEGLALLQWLSKKSAEQLHGEKTVHAGKIAQIFHDSHCIPWTVGVPHLIESSGEGVQPTIVGACNAVSADPDNLLQWKEQMQADVQKQNHQMEVPYTQAPSTSKAAHVAQLCMSDEEDAGVSYLDPGDASEELLSAVDVSELRYDQFCAYDIITWHLDQTLAGANPPPLHMLIHGEGGTGKSKDIQTMTEYFSHRAARYMLTKTAYTGVASSLINVKTTHSIAMISVHHDQTSVRAETRAKLQET